MLSGHATSPDSASWRDARQFEEAYREYTQNSLIASTSLQQPLVVASVEYGRVLQSAINDEDVQRQAEANGKYLQVLQQALTQQSIQQHTAEAFRQYLTATRQAWSDLEVHTLNPSLIVGIAQSMMVAAAVAARYVGTISTSPATSALAPWEVAT